LGTGMGARVLCSSRKDRFELGTAGGVGLVNKRSGGRTWASLLRCRKRRGGPPGQPKKTGESGQHQSSLVVHAEGGKTPPQKKTRRGTQTEEERLVECKFLRRKLRRRFTSVSGRSTKGGNYAKQYHNMPKQGKTTNEEKEPDRTTSNKSKLLPSPWDYLKRFTKASRRRRKTKKLNV